MKKRLLISSLILIVVLSLGFAISGCGHKHNYSKKVFEPTCTTDGYTKFTCSCGDTYEGEVTPKTGHDLVKADDKASTCTEKGYKDHYECANCNYEEYTETPLLTHEFEIVEEIKADCEKGINGSKTEKCLNCNYVKESVIRAVHSWETIPAQNANCYQEGWPMHSRCKNCGKADVVIYPKRHTKIVTIKETSSTCSEQGHYQYTKCETCGEEFDKELKPLRAHEKYTQTINEREATCQQVGLDVLYELCYHCDYKVKLSETEIPSHKLYEKTITDKAPTCLEDGLDVLYELCEFDCGYKKKISETTVDALGHDIETIMGKDSTCFEKGYLGYEYCKRKGCDYTTYEELPLREHSTTLYSGKNATCEEPGYKEYYACIYSDCDYNTKEEIPSLGHDEKSVAGKEANCIQYGYADYVYCTRGCYSTYREIAPLGHQLETIERKASSCLEAGHESYSKCSRKGCNYTEGYVEIPKLEHEFELNADAQLQCTKCSTIEKLLEIYKDGTVLYKVYYAENCATQFSWLNNELRSTVGWTFARQTINYPVFNEDAKVICIGTNEYSKTSGVEYYNNRETAYKISVKGNSIFLSGSDMAMRLAVYELLNILIGYEKYSIYANNLGSEIYYENKTEIILGKSQIEREIIPDIQYLLAANSGNTYDGSLGATAQGNSSMGIFFSHDLKGAAHGQNDDGVTESLRYHITAGHNTLGFFPVARYCNESLNPDTYHPNWFAKDANGKVKDDPRQVCFYGLWNDPEALEVAFNVVKQYKSSNNITMSNMDEGGDCLCEHCNNDWAYHYFKFLNQLGTKMSNDPETSHMVLKGWLYHVNSIVPPLDSNGRSRISLVDNVQILFAFDYADYYAGFSEWDRALLEKWSKVIPEMHFWTYCFKPNYSMFFFDDFTNKQKTMETIAKYGGLSLYDEGSKPAPQTTNFSALRVYLESRLSVDSGLTMSEENAKAYYESITNEFFVHYFGSASTAMRKVFEKQKSIAQYMYNNWDGEGGLYEKAYVDSGILDKQSDYFKTMIKPVNTVGNNIVGTYSSWAFHNLSYYYCPLEGKNTGNHCNRSAYAVVYEKQDFKEMLSWIDEAVDAINGDTTLTNSQKEILINRIELEKVGVLYQYMFIFENTFAIGNNSYNSSFDASDLSAIGVNSVEEAVQYFADLTRKYKINSLNATTIDKLISGWNYKYGWTIE